MPTNADTMPFGRYKGQPLIELPDDYLRDVSTFLRRESERLSAEIARRDNEAREETKTAVLENRPIVPSSKRRTRGPRLGNTGSTRARIKKLVWGTI